MRNVLALALLLAFSPGCRWASAKKIDRCKQFVAAACDRSARCDLFTEEQCMMLIDPKGDVCLQGKRIRNPSRCIEQLRNDECGTPATACEGVFR